MGLGRAVLVVATVFEWPLRDNAIPARCVTLETIEAWSAYQGCAYSDPSISRSHHSRGNDLSNLLPSRVLTDIKLKSELK